MHRRLILTKDSVDGLVFESAKEISLAAFLGELATRAADVRALVKEPCPKLNADDVRDGLEAAAVLVRLPPRSSARRRLALAVRTLVWTFILFVVILLGAAALAFPEQAGRAVRNINGWLPSDGITWIGQRQAVDDLKGLGQWAGGLAAALGATAQLWITYSAKESERRADQDRLLALRDFTPLLGFLAQRARDPSPEPSSVLMDLRATILKLAYRHWPGSTFAVYEIGGKGGSTLSLRHQEPRSDALTLPESLKAETLLSKPGVVKYSHWTRKGGEGEFPYGKSGVLAPIRSPTTADGAVHGVLIAASPEWRTFARIDEGSLAIFDYLSLWLGLAREIGLKR